MKTSQTPTPIAAMRRIGFISETLHTVDPDEPILTVKEFFDTHAPISAVVVEKQNRAVGLVMNIHLNLKLSQRYGFSLFSKKPISSIMDPSPLTVAHDQSIEQAAALAMQRRSDRLYDHIIILKNQRPYGVVAVRTILNSLLESNRERTDILERYTGRLEKEDLEKRKAIQGLEDSRKMLQLVIDAIPHAIFWKDRNCVYLGCNQTFARDAGIQETRQVVGLSDRELPWTRQPAWRPFAR